jgi:hypothetical protein
MGPYGEFRGPVIWISNVKVAKNFTLFETKKLQFNAEVFNVFNTSSATSTSYLTGPTYLQTTGIVAPVVARIGMKFSF